MGGLAGRRFETGAAIECVLLLFVTTQVFATDSI